VRIPAADGQDTDLQLYRLARQFAFVFVAGRLLHSAPMYGLLGAGPAAPLSGFCGSSYIRPSFGGLVVDPQRTVNNSGHTEALRLGGMHKSSPATEVYVVDLSGNQ
jgi:hypothetical protein